MKKQIIIFLLTALSMAVAFANEDEKNESVYPSRNTKDLLGPRNSIGLTYGAVPFDNFFSFFGIVKDKTGCFSLDYSYRINEKFSFIVNFGYSAENFHLRNNPIGEDPQTRVTVDDSKPLSFGFLISAIPLVKYSWVRSEIVELYSAAGMGLSYLYKDNIYEVRTPMHIIPIGITIGKKVYLKAEYGIGTMGFVRAGVGIKF